MRKHMCSALMGAQSESEESRAQQSFCARQAANLNPLACFVNAATCEAVSLAQSCGLQEDDVKKLFLVSRRERCISQDFEVSVNRELGRKRFGIVVLRWKTASRVR